MNTELQKLLGIPDSAKPCQHIWEDDHQTVLVWIWEHKGCKYYKFDWGIEERYPLYNDFLKQKLKENSNESSNGN